MAKFKLGSRGLELILVALIVSILTQAPQLPLPQTTSGFSLERAKASLATIAAAARPRGSEQHARAREYLLDELNSLGIEVELQRGGFERSDFVSERAAGPDRGAAEHGRLTNIVARKPGSASTGTILLLAHYDSVQGSPGAADDGAGCVAVLEAMRAVAAAQPRNDVVALFSDGEEEGLRGARLFADEHPLFASIDLVLNFEAIGNGGPAVMFESGPGSGGLIDLWASRAPEPRGNTIAPVIYGWMPNDTDFSIFRDAGLRGLNFALCGGSGAYHQASDTPERLEDRALGHLAQTAVELSLALGQTDLAKLEGGARSFDAQPLFGAITWTHRAHLWIASVPILVWVLWTWRRARIGALGFARGTGSMLLLAALSGLAAFAGASAWLAIAQPELPLDYNTIHFLLALMVACASVATLLGCLLWSQRNESRQRELWSASPLPWIILFACFAKLDFEHQGASYPLAWAAVCACAASALRLRGASSLAAALVLTPAIFQVGPILGQLVQLASQDVQLSARLGSLLIALGTPLVLPALLNRPGSHVPSRRVV